MIGMDIQGIKVAVTGASGVIGRAIAEGFLQHGASVANWDLAESVGANALAEQYGGNYLFCPADMADEARVEAAAARTAAVFGGIDVLVNNAGIIAKQQVDQLDETVMDKLYQVNVKGVMLAAKHAVPYLKRSGRGRIINMSSVQVALGMETYTPYTYTKAAVSGVTRVWALELAAHGITVNALCPGWADTDMANTHLVDRLAQLHGVSRDQAMENILSYVPQRRFIKVEEIAFACLYLSSTLGAAVNGAELFLDGGLAHCAKAGLSMIQPQG